MYRKILVALENSQADKALVPHVTELARRLQSHLLLVHVADGWVARNFDELKLRESEEMREDRAYLERLCQQLSGRGFDCRARLALGDPVTELVKVADEEKVDLIAMSTHGHRFFQDLLRGSTADRLRHGVVVPVLMVRAK